MVGVVANTKQKELNAWDSPYFYVPILQFPAETITLHVRTAGDVASLSGTVRDVVGTVDRGTQTGLKATITKTTKKHAKIATSLRRDL